MSQRKKHVPRSFDQETVRSELVKIYRQTAKGELDAEAGAKLAVILRSLHEVVEPQQAA